MLHSAEGFAGRIQIIDIVQQEGTALNSESFPDGPSLNRSRDDQTECYRRTHEAQTESH